MFRTGAIWGARFTPRFIKSFVHNNRSIDNLSRKLYGKMLGPGTAVIESGPMKGLKLVLGPNVSHAHIRGVYEGETLKTVDQLVKPGFICYDLGASIGYLSLLMARKAKHVYAFEPAPHAIEELRKHVAANQMTSIVTLVPTPVSNNVREVSFAVTDVLFGSAINEIETRWPVHKLTTTTLDLFVRDHPAPDFVKIDVEGEEGRVLEGARELLANKRPAICCEVHSPEAADQALRVLGNCQYAVTRLNGEPFEVTEDMRAGDVQVICLPR
jgi:FkbM family methyltransferase